MKMEGVEPTLSPSMDIQISSNFERLIFESAGRDAEAVNRMMAALKQSRGFDLPERSISTIRQDFDAGTTDETATRRVIAETLAGSGYLLDPHTAVGLGVALAMPASTVPMITLGTAHPAKFPVAVAAATGTQPQLPTWLADLFDRPERLTVLANDQREIEDFIAARSRA